MMTQGAIQEHKAHDDFTVQSAFTVDGKCHYAKEDIDNLLKQALLDKSARLENNIKSQDDEFAADVPTFVKTFFNLTAFNIGQSIAALLILKYIYDQTRAKKDDYKQALDIWAKLRRDLARPDANIEESYRHAFNRITNAGLAFEGLDEVDLTKFDDARFEKEATRYSASALERLKSIPYQGDKIKHGLKHFIKGLKENIKEPEKFRTPKAVLEGFKDSFRMASSWTKHVRQGFDPLHKRLMKLKAEYEKTPIEIAHWNRALKIEKEVAKNFRHMRFLFLAFAAETAFMALHGAEGAHNTYNLFDSSLNAVEKLESGGFLLVNLFSIAAAAGPWKGFGRDISQIFKKITSHRAELAENYILMHNDREEIEKHDTPDAGFRARALML